MRPENFVYFFTVCGFFIGMVFSILNFSAAENILLYTLEITLFFYLLVHVVLTYFVDVGNLSRTLFDKEKYEEVADFFIYEIEDRERKINSLLGVFGAMNKKHEEEAK